ncbi:hypothetical protein [Tissierella sp. P1]|uniref:hypothetical protein n=1 Tax=Tissierella sp. P1 TaxID=1280483 RepID=UPI001303975A|nr:hypothetical protein [Tissierella sp. P1]
MLYKHLLSLLISIYLLLEIIGRLIILSITSISMAFAIETFIANFAMTTRFVINFITVTTAFAVNFATETNGCIYC